MRVVVRADGPGTVDVLRNGKRESGKEESVNDVERVECYVGCREECMLLGGTKS